MSKTINKHKQICVAMENELAKKNYYDVRRQSGAAQILESVLAEFEARRRLARSMSALYSVISQENNNNRPAGARDRNVWASKMVKSGGGGADEGEEEDGGGAAAVPLPTMHNS